MAPLRLRAREGRCAVASRRERERVWREEGFVDRDLQRFLDSVRRTARHDHLATYEDLAVELEDYLRARRRRASRLASAELGRFLGSWYLRQQGSASSRRTRRFCAATRVLVRWLATHASARRRDALLRESRRLARATARAARASELLESVEARPAAAVTEVVEDYFEVVARGGTHVALRPLSRGEHWRAAPLGPVAVPAQLAASLDPGALVNLQLGRSRERWTILGYGFCYPSSARAVLCDALTLETHG